MKFIGDRASGKYITAASWIRNFVVNHPDYKKDSVVTHKINYDLVEACNKIALGQLEVPELLPSVADRKLPEGYQDKY